MADIDSALARRLIVEAIGDHASLREAEMAGLYIVPVRDRVIEMCLPFGRRCIQQMVALPAGSRVEMLELEQSAAMGICEGVANYNVNKRYKGRPIAITTHLYVWVRKHVYDCVHRTHWVIAQPTHDDRKRFMADEMSDIEREAYKQNVLAPVSVAEYGSARSHFNRKEYDAETARDEMQR